MLTAREAEARAEVLMTVQTTHDKKRQYKQDLQSALSELKARFKVCGGVLLLLLLLRGVVTWCCVLLTSPQFATVLALGTSF